MPKIKLAFDVGNSALKIAVWRGGALELRALPTENMRLSAKTKEENT